MLGQKIRQEKDIEGIEIGEINKKLAQYVDDLWIAMLHKDKCYKAIFKILDSYGKFSGLKINYEKLKCYGLANYVIPTQSIIVSFRFSGVMALSKYWEH